MWTGLADFCVGAGGNSRKTRYSSHTFSNPIPAIQSDLDVL